MATPQTPTETEDAQQDFTPDGGPLLDLDTLITRPTIAITHDGTRHVLEILSPDELSIIDSHRFGLWGRRITQLADEDSDEAEAELTALINKVARRVAVGVPDEIYAVLSGAHKQAISDVFTGLLLRKRIGVAGAIARAAGVPMEMQEGLGISQQIGAKPSPASSGSLDKARSGGWLKRLLPWSGRS